MSDEVKKYCCNFCTADVSDVDGRSHCPLACFEEAIGSYPYEIAAANLAIAADPDCEECEGKGHVECEECGGTGYVEYECHNGVGEVEWVTKEGA
jgi:hypothetical protein